MAIKLIVIAILKSVSWIDHQAAGEYVFQSRDEMIRQWINDGGKEKDAVLLPNNFEKETVVAIFAGQKPSGHRIRIEGVIKTEDNKTAWVIYKEIAPPAGEKQSTKPAYPNHVVSIPKTEGTFKFLDTDSNEAQQLKQRAMQQQEEEAKKQQRQPQK